MLGCVAPPFFSCHSCLPAGAKDLCRFSLLFAQLFSGTGRAGSREENGSPCVVAKSQAADRAFTRNRTGYTSENARRLVRCRNLSP